MNSPEVIVFVGLGSNQGDPIDHLQSALRALGKLPSCADLSCSSFYRSAPVGNMLQPDFVNAVCRFQTRLAVAHLMADLLAIEHTHGRVRSGAPGGPRTLDLDLLLYGREMIDVPGLVVPHPRLHQRAFVLAPLLELDPSGGLAGVGTYSALLAACRGQRIERIGTPDRAHSARGVGETNLHPGVGSA